MHIAFLKKLFRNFGYEDSLMAAFDPAATTRPDARRNFDTITMTEAEKGFKEHMEKVDKEVNEMAPAIAESDQKLEAAENREKEAEKAMRDAGLDYGRALTQSGVAKGKAADARKLTHYVPKSHENAISYLYSAEKDCGDLFDTPAAAYQWLKARIAVLDGRVLDTSPVGTLLSTNIRQSVRLRPTQRQLLIGVGWDRDESAKVDLDVSAVVVGDKGDHELCTVFSSRRRAPGIMHSGDVASGATDVDKQSIQLNLDELQVDARQIYFAVGVFTERRSFADLTACHCRIEDQKSEEELMKFRYGPGGQHPGLIMARLFKDNVGQWNFQKIGLFTFGRTSFKIMPDIIKAKEYLGQASASASESFSGSGMHRSLGQASVAASESLSGSGMHRRREDGARG
jgi:stress response protein SCP2